MKFWIATFGTMISAGLLAQTNLPDATTATTTAPPTFSEVTNQPPATPTPKAHATGKKKKTVKKAAVKKPAPVLCTVPLVPGPAVVAANHVNVRTKPSMVGEIVTRMTNGDPVMVIEEIKLKHSGPDEPSAWAKIVLPVKSAAWVNAKFIDPTNKIVTAKKLNIRGGPGENYGVIGTLQKGDAINEVITQGDWTKIDAPTNGYAFMAAQYLKQEAPGEMPAPAPTPEPAPPVTPVAEAPAVPATTEAPASAPTNEIPAATPAPTPAPAPEIEPTNEVPTEPRIVTHEGFVRGTVSIQAPTSYALISSDTGATVNYLFTTSKELDLSRYKGLRIIVTGEESLDQRWPHTPIITIQKIQVVE